jgi:hypothetical protein
VNSFCGGAGAVARWYPRQGGDHDPEQRYETYRRSTDFINTVRLFCRDNFEFLILALPLTIPFFLTYTIVTRRSSFPIFKVRRCMHCRCGLSRIVSDLEHIDNIGYLCRLQPNGGDDSTPRKPLCVLLIRRCLSVLELLFDPLRPGFFRRRRIVHSGVFTSGCSALTPLCETQAIGDAARPTAAEVNDC